MELDCGRRIGRAAGRITREVYAENLGTIWRCADDYTVSVVHFGGRTLVRYINENGIYGGLVEVIEGTPVVGNGEVKLNQIVLRRSPNAKEWDGPNGIRIDKNSRGDMILTNPHMDTSRYSTIIDFVNFKVARR